MRLAFAALLLALAACSPAPRPGVQPIPSSGSSALPSVPPPGESDPGRRTEAPGTSSTAPAPTAAIATALVELRGVASWYRYHPGQAAAGPRLRAFLGKGWRGTRVRVCTAVCIWVTLTDWMKRDRLIDLDQRDFEWLAPASKGLVRVVVER